MVTVPGSDEKRRDADSSPPPTARRVSAPTCSDGIKKFGALTFDAPFRADGITFGGFISSPVPGVDYPAWGLVP